MKVKLISNVWADTNEFPKGLNLNNTYKVIEVFYSNPFDKYYRIIDDNGDEQGWNSECFEVVEQDITCPTIYKHFKHTEDGELNNYMYVTMGISEPLEASKFPKDIWDYNMIETSNTETGKVLVIHSIGNKFYHPKENCSDKMVIYKSLYDGSRPYARPLDMFASKVDKEKYPNVKQEFRFEIVRY